MDEKNKQFSKNLCHYMEMAGISKTELAKRLDVSNATISLYCSGKNVPRMDKVKKLAIILGVKVSDLVGDVELPMLVPPQMENTDMVLQLDDGAKMLLEYHYIKGAEKSVERMQKFIEKVVNLSPKDMNFVESMVDRLVGEQ